jgi:transposase
MRERDQRRQEVFVPLAHPPGHGQADFGEAMVVIAGMERKAHFFVLDLPHSDGCYVRAYAPVSLPSLRERHHGA